MYENTQGIIAAERCGCHRCLRRAMALPMAQPVSARSTDAVDMSRGVATVRRRQKSGYFAAAYLKAPPHQPAVK